VVLVVPIVMMMVMPIAMVERFARWQKPYREKRGLVRVFSFFLR
jgi:hypothetical protein